MEVEPWQPRDLCRSEILLGLRGDLQLYSHVTVCSGLSIMRPGMLWDFLRCFTSLYSISEHCRTDTHAAVSRSSLEEVMIGGESYVDINVPRSFPLAANSVRTLVALQGKCLPLPTRSHIRLPLTNTYCVVFQALLSHSPNH